jgi:ferrochelatase
MNQMSGAKKNQRGLLLLNLGTPDAPEPKAVGRYLKQFLMDKWVVDIAKPLRWFLVHVLIVPRRKFASALAYQLVWSKRGSPLRMHLEDLKNALVPRLPDYQIATGMRYGNPSIESGLRSLQATGVEEIVVFALYPQYAESSSRSSREECERVAAVIGLKAKLIFYPAFYDDAEFINAYADILRPKLEKQNPDHILFSFHGLPERHVKRVDRSPTGHCLKSPDCCAAMNDANRDCYRAQSYATARALGRALNLPTSKWSVSFQSRLGRTPWIQPFTDFVLVEMPAKGIKSLAVACPSFAADCLETLEEIGMRGAEEFKKAGGIEFQALECPNAHPRWVEAVERMIRGHHLGTSTANFEQKSL